MCTQLEGIQKASYLKTELPFKTGKTRLHTKSGPGHWHIT